MALINRNMKTVIYLFLIVLVSSPAAGDKKNPLEITEVVIAEGVDNLVPTGVVESFSPGVGRLFCFTRVEGAVGETVIKHLWFYEDRLMADVTLPVRSENWRTYSSKRILKAWKGNWRVDITDGNGLLLKVIHFRIE